MNILDINITKAMLIQPIIHTSPALPISRIFSVLFDALFPLPILRQL